MGDRLLVIDEGTSSTRAMLFDLAGQCLGIAQNPLTTNFPRPGWVEQDAAEIWRLSLAVARQMVAKAGGAQGIAGIGITNQRETLICWDRRTGEPLAPAIVWQDRRTAALCFELKEAGHEPFVQEKTGLLLDPYFSASKIGWALKQWPQLREAGESLCIGTVDSWLVFKLTGGLHLTDATNASRTALMDIAAGWDDGLLDLFDARRSALPEICDSAGRFGETQADLFGGPISICGIAGDQQAAAIGQACFGPGETKATYGTGAFILTQAGTDVPRSRNRLLSTIAWQIEGERHYALEGSLFVAGRMIQWLRDELRIVEAAPDSEALARSVPDSGGVQIVPAFVGLGAPHWDPDARAAILGLTLGSGRPQIVRAALEAVANQTAELQRAFAADGVRWSSLRIDGGMSANGFLAQDLADLLGLEVQRPANFETSALGAAMLAGVGAGLFGSLDEAAAAVRGPVARFSPGSDDSTRRDRMERWDRAVAAARGA
ncbi:MAG TPA: glycerol kinase [Sphingomicrobium sp.]|nr:glycerol kinase [Sphingomicrobium sp.]